MIETIVIFLAGSIAGAIFSVPIHNWFLKRKITLPSK